MKRIKNLSRRKKITLALFVIAAALVLSGAGQKPAGNQSVQFSASVDMSYEVRASTNVADMTIGEMRVGYNPSVMFEALQGELPADMLALAGDMRMDTLRFPGGTISNKYHFYRTGYGRDNEDNSAFSENFLETFVDFVKATNPNTEVFFVLNVFEHFPNNLDNKQLQQENMDALAYLFNNDVNVVGVECGNEMYAYLEVIGIQKKNQQSVRKNVTEYVDLCRSYDDMIQEQYPGLAMGIPWARPNDAGKRAYNATWLEQGADFVDAYIPHIYGEIRSSCSMADEDCIAASLDAFLEKRLAEVAYISNAGYDVWVTEMSAINHGHDDTKNRELAFSEIKRQYTAKFLTLLARHGADYVHIHRLLGSAERDSYNHLTHDSETNTTTLTPIGEDFLVR